MAYYSIIRETTKYAGWAPRLCDAVIIILLQIFHYTIHNVDKRIFHDI